MLDKNQSRESMVAPLSNGARAAIVTRNNSTVKLQDRFRIYT